MTAPTESEDGPRSSASPASRLTDGSRYRRRSALVALLAVLAAVGAAFAAGAPTGVGPLDLALRVVFAVGVTLSAVQARRWAWTTATGLTVLLAVESTEGFVAAGVLFALAVASAVLDRRSRVTGALVGAGVALLALWIPPTGPIGRNTVLGGLAAVVLVVSGVRNSPRRVRRTAKVVLVAVGVLALVATASTAIGAARARADAIAGADAARAALQAARAGDTATAQAGFDVAAERLRRAQRILDAPWARAGRAVPVVSQHDETVRRMVRNAVALAEAGAFASRNADVDALRSVDGRLDPRTVAALEGPLDSIDDALRSARRELDTPPSPWLVGPLRDQVDEVRDDLAQAAHDSRTARLAVQAAPDLLGVDRPRRYFVMFTTPTEGRAGGGGFMGNWGILTAADGQLDLTEFGRTDTLNRAPRTLDGPAEYLARYTQFGPTQDWRNVNLAPDFPTVVEVVRRLAPQSGAGPIDGVIAVNPRGLARLLRLTGPVTVPGLAEPLSADNAARFLLRDQYVAFPDTAERVDFLGDAARAVTDRFTSSSLPAPREVGRVLAPAVRHGDLSFVSFDPAADTLLRRIGTTGALPTRRGDSFGVVTQNASASKLELFLHRSVDLRTALDPATGRQRTTATIRLRNDAPPSGLPGYVIGNAFDLPAGTSRLYVSAYSPLATTAATLDGQPIALAAGVESGVRVQSTYVTIAPGAEAVLVLELEGRLRVARGDGTARYRLALWRTAMVHPDDVAVTVTTGEGRLTEPAVRLRPEADATAARYTGRLRGERLLGVTLRG